MTSARPAVPRCYVPAVYWTVVTLVSVVGTLVTDNLTDGRIAYVLTRSLGDFLSGDRAEGGAGLGTLLTTLLFLTAIIATVIYLSVTRLDRTERARR